jgi:hypothetical protein
LTVATRAIHSGGEHRTTEHSPERAEEADVNAVLAPAALTAADRCDRCSAQAYVRATLHAGGELLFCAHHGREHIPALAGLAEIHDESDRLTEPTPTLGGLVD